jgi:hypothetical protein
LKPLDPASSAQHHHWLANTAPGGIVDFRWLEELYDAVATVATSIDNIRADKNLEATIQAAPPFLAFLDALTSQVLYLGPVAMDAAVQGSKEDLFPFYFSLDVGAAALSFHRSWDFAQYLGVNMYLIPVDPGEPLRRGRHEDYGRAFARRFSVTLGITTTASQIHRNGVQGLVGSQFLMIGAGLRVLEFVRVSAGTFLFRVENANPLRAQTHVAAGGYFGASLDLAAFKLIAEGFKGMTGG